MPRAWPESTITILGSGPSLTAPDILLASYSSHLIAINSTYLLAPWADVIYAPDRRFYDWHPDVLELPCLKFAFQIEAEGLPGVTVLQRTGYSGLELRPWGLRSGGHSGYAAINLAVHLGAKHIVLLGYDHSPDGEGRHHFEGGDHPDGSHLPDYTVHRDAYDTLVKPLAELGITVINASPVSAITAFPRLPLEQALCFRSPTLSQVN